MYLGYFPYISKPGRERKEMNAPKILKPFCKIGLHIWVDEYWLYYGSGVQVLKKCLTCYREESEFKPDNKEERGEEEI